MSDVVQDPTQIGTRIRRNERALQREQERCGVMRDGAGIRDLMGPLSVLVGDTEGALRSRRMGDRIRYLSTVDLVTSMPTFRSSPTIDPA